MAQRENLTDVFRKKNEELDKMAADIIKFGNNNNIKFFDKQIDSPQNLKRKKDDYIPSEINITIDKNTSDRTIRLELRHPVDVAAINDMSRELETVADEARPVMAVDNGDLNDYNVKDSEMNIDSEKGLSNGDVTAREFLNSSDSQGGDVSSNIRMLYIFYVRTC